MRSYGFVVHRRDPACKKFVVPLGNSSRQSDFLFLAAIAVDLVPSAKGDGRNRGGNSNTRKAPRERPLDFVRMQKDSRSEDLAAGRDHVPAIGVMIPTGIGMADGDIEPPLTAPDKYRLDAEHVGFAGRCDPESG